MLKDDLLPNIVQGFTANILAYAVLLAAVATITMALLELAKAVLHLRLFYHRFMIKYWLKGGKRYEELLILAVGEKDSSSVLLDQPTDKLMGQIQAASNVVMDFPNVYPEIYAFLTHVPQPHTNKASVNKSDSDIWKEFSGKVESSSSKETINPDIQIATRARARLDHFVARKLDAFQTRAEYKWARINQLVAVGGSAIFISYLLQHVSEYTPTQTFFLSIFGGMLAPFAKDVVTALSNLRTK